LSRLLDETNRNIVKQALREAARTIKEAASKAADSNDYEQNPAKNRREDNRHSCR